MTEGIYPGGFVQRQSTTFANQEEQNRTERTEELIEQATEPLQSQSVEPIQKTQSP